MHFSTSLYLFGFLALGAAFPKGVSARDGHQRFHRRHTQVEGVVPAEVTPAVVEPAHVEPATVEGPPNNAIVDVSTPPDNALAKQTSTAAGVAGNQTVPTTLATIVKISEASTLLTSLPAPLPTSELYAVPTTNGTHGVSHGDGAAPTTSTTGKTVSSTPLAIVTSSAITTESTGVVTSTEGGLFSNSSSTSSPCASTAIDTPSTSPSTGVNATTTSFSTFATSAAASSITSTPPTTNTTITSSSSRNFLITTSTSTPTAAWSSPTKTSLKHSTLTTSTPTTTTYRLTFATPSASAVASQSKDPNTAEFNKTKPCFDKKCDNPGSEMTYNKTVTFHVDSKGNGGIGVGKGPDVASFATIGRNDGTLRMGMAVMVVIGVNVALAVL